MTSHVQSANARMLALEVLLACRRRDAFIQEALDRRLANSILCPADRRLATQLAYGVLRRQGTLDALIGPALCRPWRDVEPWLLDVLRLGVFQLTLLAHVPPHAAVHETVELAKHRGRPKAKAFLNGVLRAVSQLLTADTAGEPSSDALPLADGTYRRLARRVLPEPATNPVEYVASAFALPSWLASRWLQRWGWLETLRLGFWFAGPAPLWLRCSPGRGREPCLQALQQAGIRAEPGRHPQSVRLAESAAIRDLPGYADGWFVVQDESAMAVGSALNPTPGGRVLDLCAAPGGKTTHLAELMQGVGEIIACDVDDRRLRTLRAQCHRLGISMVRPLRLDPADGPPPGPFDAALVDVPCSNTGVLGRRPEVRWRLRPADFQRLIPLQTRLLQTAAERVRPGGVIVYSTCSIEPEENADVVRTALQAVPDLELEADEFLTPGRPADGGYWARLRRTRKAGSHAKR